MGLQQVTEVAALIAANSRRLIEAQGLNHAEPLQAAWQAARSHLIGTLRRIDDCVGGGVVVAPPPAHDAQWEQLKPLMADVFAVETLTRVWGGVLTARDRYHQGSQCGEVARNVLILQLQVRQRALSLLVERAAEQTKPVAEVDRLRRKLERWTDVLLAEMVIRDGVTEFACDPRRSCEYGIDYFKNQSAARQRLTWRLLSAGMRSCFSAPDVAAVSQFPVPQELLNALVASMPGDLFCTDGPSRALTTHAVEHLSATPEAPPQEPMMRRFDRLELLLTGLNSPERKTSDGINFSKLRKEQG